MAPQLSRRFHIFAPDQRGHGDTAHAGAYRTQDFVDDLEALRAHWGLERFVLMGLSMGGHNAMAYAATHPDRVERLIVIDIPPRIDRTKAPNWDVISRLAETGHRRYADFEAAYADARLANKTAPDANLRYRTQHNLVEQSDGSLVLKYDAKAPARWEPEDLTDKISRITAPVLLVRGALSEVITREAAQRMTALFQTADLVEVPQSGHSVPTDRPEALTPVVLDWLTSVDARR